MIRRPPRSTLDRSSAASDVYKRQVCHLCGTVPGDLIYVGTDVHIYSNHIKQAKMQLERLGCLLYTSPSPRDRTRSRMPSSA